MSLLRDVVAVLRARNISHALIGATAMAVHGVSRSTADIDLLTVDAGVLRHETWRDLESRGAQVRVLKGDSEDPLAGTVRVSARGDRTVDIVVGRHRWQQRLVDAAEVMSIGEADIRVVRPAGLVLLKLYAGGPRDAWDVRALLESHEQAEAIKAEVDAGIDHLPAECSKLWTRIRDAR